jgi:hypothetical protein
MPLKQGFSAKYFLLKHVRVREFYMVIILCKKNYTHTTYIKEKKYCFLFFYSFFKICVIIIKYIGLLLLL